MCDYQRKKCLPTSSGLGQQRSEPESLLINLMEARASETVPAEKTLGCTKPEHATGHPRGIKSWSL